MTTSDRPPALFRTVSHASTASDRSGNDAWSRSRAVAQRLSMEEYYHSHVNTKPRRESVSSNSDPVDDPPSYDVAVNGLHLPITRLKIEPREDQGREQLPAYSCSIMMRAVFSKKMELETAVHTAFDRKWYQVYAELQGTALRFYKVKSAGMFAAGGGPNTSADDPPYLKPGELLKVYSLQHADVGIAADYIKRPYVIRVRVEADQFLLSCVEIETFLTWLESLTAAIDLAPPLDERKLPKDTSYPYRHRRRGLATEAIPEEPAVPPSIAELRNDDNRSDRSGRSSSSRPSTGAESVALEEILLSGPPPPSSHQGRPTRRPRQAPTPPPATPRPSDFINYANPHPPAPIPATTAAAAPANMARVRAPLLITAASAAPPNPDITPDGKWRPVHNWSARHDLVYAKRCMAVLLANTPRKTNLVIMRGRQWIVDWATGALTRWEPPAYDPPVYAELVGPWHVLGPSGSYLRT